ncbi:MULTISPECIES: enoyl-CoA hydratase/isomerase family protein [Rhodomicrobium]|uniref:enoyl-CoA hydratase/isomerase family protein n=1 Tax=Rhodomicrobium TaxID=1068 RepID=UPI000B4A84F4|nr:MULTISPECIES: enoyl-CoA hydratase/isomerase family protein [Rhodomicrobium]
MTEPSSPTADIIIREEGRAGFLTLNRPKALNALTHAMIRTLEAQRLKWAGTARIYGVILDAVPGRAFCGGGDIRATNDVVDTDFDAVAQFFRDEYQHNWTLECFTKPNVALVDGIVMGGGVGISIYGTHRVAGEKLVFAMPETNIGFFPDIGAGYFLPRFPGETGMYLGLTGASIGRADAFQLGYATHCIDAAHFDAIRRAMIEGDPIDAVLGALHRDPGEGELARHRPAIDRIFAADSVEAILSRLDAESGADADWARETAAIIRQRAPLSVKVAFRQLREGRAMPSLREELTAEFRLTWHMLRGRDLREGVRAALIDRDRSPKWQPATLADVTDAMVDACFAPLGADELKLKDHWTLVD